MVKIIKYLFLQMAFLTMACSESLWEPYDYLKVPIPDVVFVERNLGDVCELLVHLRNQYTDNEDSSLIVFDSETIPTELAGMKVSVGFEGLNLSDTLDILNALYGLSLNLAQESNAVVLRNISSESFESPNYMTSLDFFIVSQEDYLVSRAFVRVENTSDTSLLIENTFKGEVVYEKTGIVWSKISALQESASPSLIDVNKNQWMHKSLVCTTGCDALLARVIIDGEGRWFRWKASSVHNWGESQKRVKVSR